MLFSVRLKEILVHVGFWIVFISWEIYVARGVGSTAPLSTFACFYALNIGLFYFNAHVASKWSGKRNSVLLFILILLVELGCYDLLSIGLDILINSIHAGHLSIYIIPADHKRSLFRGGYFLALSTGYYYLLSNAANSRRAYDLLQLKLQAELREAALENAHLRAQINSHMAFNVLNFIFIRVSKISPQLTQCLRLFINSIRYSLGLSQEDGLVKLSEELEQIERLIQINQLLSNNRLSVIKNLNAPVFDDNLRIPPLLLFTFIENMFKHGNLEDAPGIITLNVQEHNLNLYTENLYSGRQKFISEHIGIQNAKARLEKYYYNNYNLESRLIGDKFIVDLKIKL